MSQLSPPPTLITTFIVGATSDPRHWPSTEAPAPAPPITVSSLLFRRLPTPHRLLPVIIDIPSLQASSLFFLKPPNRSELLGALRSLAPFPSPSPYHQPTTIVLTTNSLFRFPSEESFGWKAWSGRRRKPPPVDPAPPPLAVVHHPTDG
ncbi:hypothetical protein COCNU_02G011390 [Cocos nucifera]|uniref:Uncharacterized protein n=1 Tax=Cocos nucifera TaxID=13894 RepID=A0A8K0HZH8_COCNU|nr:hypothetical protein COCNU_02G011390 [Cocos nucifera]